MPLSLFLLGPPRVEIDGEVIAFPRQKSLALLVHLAVTGEQQRRDSLAALLWPESADARGSLRRELSSLKSALGNGDWLDAQRENVTLTGDVRLDVDDFLAAVESGDPARWRQAADLYRDNFLTGFSLADSPAFDDWQFFQAEEYRRICAATLEELIAHFQAAGDPDAAIPYARRLLALDNLHELSHRILMCLYALAGQQSAALRQYDECVRLLDEELGVPPEAETTELHEAIRTRRFPAEDDRVTRGQDDKRTVAGQPGIPSSGYLVIPSPLHNLPPQATPFVGRQREVEALRGLLSAPANRLVTITGVGGIGKSRLSLAVAEALRGTFPDGVWFVPLAPLEAAEAVPRAIADALSVPTGDGNSHSLLLHFLRDKQLLLLLDNFEHLLDGADFLAELLQNAPRVKLLVTSQERLNLHEESLYPLGGLEEAARLFIERARRVQPNFDPTAEGEAIGVICRTVEGMPLAIELAASWVRVMACAEIAAEIQHSADFLASNTRNLPARHRSLRALFERSWALLDPDERTLLARLSVFQGGFTRQAAIAVADATPHQLAELVDHSFLRHQADDRFDMHGLLHRFAAEQLAVDSAVERDARQRHAEFYAELVAQAGWELEPADPAASAAADRDGPNILAAWRWGVEQRYPSVVGRMTRWLGDYFRRRGDLLGGRAIFHKAVEAFRSSSADIESAGFLGSLLSQLGQCGDHDNLAENVDQLNEAVRYLRQARSLRPLDLAQALAFLALMQASFGQNGEGAERIEEALGIFREVQNDLGTGAALNSMCVLFWGWGRLREAQKYAEEAARIFEGQEHASYLISRYGIGSILCGRGHFRRAEAILQGLIPQFKALDEQEMAYQSRLTLVDLYTATGNFPAAKEQYSQAYAFADTLGKGYQVTIGMFLSPAALARLSGEPDAEKQLLDGLAVARQIGFEQRISTSLHHLARLRHDQRDYEGALALLDEALTVARKIDFRYATALALTGQGHSQLALKEVDAARTAYAEALEIAEIEGIDRIACDALTGVAQLAHLRGESPLALSLLHFVHTHEASEWETKRRAERLLADLPRTESHTPFPSLAEAIRLARAMLDDKMTGGQDDRQSAKGHPVILSSLHLPTPATSFIGRESELAELSALLSRPDVRLATVVAPGGMGKTRFAIEAARRLAGDFPDGVWFLPLVGVNEASQMLAALVQLLDAPMGAGGAKEALLRYFARCRLLLVLDNFEQLADAAPVLAELLAGGPGVKLLVTSRVRLNLREEWVFPLTGLATADRGRQTADGRGATGSAVRLFVERAGQVQPDFDAEAEAEAVAAICRAVEGMPLGIELAASWLRAMNCAEIAVEIRRDVDFLSTPLRNVPEQHRSMRVVFERSWGLLTADEQRGLARLSVFQSGFTRQAAQAVADVRLPLLSALVDHSLLRHSASGRYDVHELLRQFAAEQLDRTELAETVRDKHADYFLHRLIARWEDLAWRGLEQALAELVPERENLFAGWSWASQSGLFTLLRDAATVLPLYCNLINARESGWELFAEAIAAVEEKAGAADDRPGLLGILRFRQQVELRNSHNQPEAYLKRLLETRELLLASNSDHREELARLSGAIGTQTATVGRGEEGAAWMEDAIRTFQETGNFFEMGKIYYRFALLRTGEGKVRLADETFGKVAEAWQQAKLPPYPVMNRGIVYHMQGRYAEMYQLWEKGAVVGNDPFMRGFSSMGGTATIEIHLAEASVALGALDEAATHFQKAKVLYEAQGGLWEVVLGFQFSYGTVLRLQGQMEAARRQIEWEVATVRSTGFDQRIATRLHELARLEFDEGRYVESEAALAEALAIAESIDFRFVVALVLCQKGHTAAAQGKPEAAGFYRRALEIAAEQGMNGIVLDVLLGVGQMNVAVGKIAEAARLLSIVTTHPNGDWETKQRAKRLLAGIPQEADPSPIPSLEGTVHIARAALDSPIQSTNQPLPQSPIHLPTPPTSFIGRESELTELSALLSRPDVRLATVVAPGGMGKTRFAIEAARRLAGDYPDGIWFLSLVGVNESSQMLAALVQLLGAPMGAGGAKEALLRYFARRRLLVVLDNFEQMVDAAPVLAELLAGGPGVKMLVTSRVRLNLREEWVFPLTGLATADRGRQTADGRGATGSAVRLFVERAQQVQPDFDAAGERQAVAAICGAVEGMPLGIELAASWLRAMNCAEIAVEIRRDVDFLSTPLRNVPEQHRSMRAVFERSWGLLTADEQRGLARLSVFQGGFTRQAAQAVAEVRLPLLSALVDHSLLRHSASGRYDIHELLRQFAAEQLEERESSDAIHDHHAAYFLELLAAHTDDIQWRRPYETVAELLPDRENFIAGWKRAVQRNLFQSIQQAATTFLVFGNHINAQVVVRNALQAALAQIEKAKDLTANTRNDLIGRILWRVAVLDTLHRDTEIHLAQLSRAKIHLQNVAVDNREEIAVVDIYVAMALGTLGRNNEAVDCLEQSVATFLALENYARLGWAYTMCCYLELGRGRPALAHRWHDLSLAAWRQGGITGSSFLSELLLYSLEGKFEQMRTAGENALQNLPDPFRFENSTGGGRGTILYTIGEWSVFCGAFDEAENYFQQAASILSEEGRAWQLAMGFRTSMATLYRLQHKWELARTHIQSLLKTIRGIGFKQRIAIRLHELAQLEHDLGNYSEAESALAEALEIAHSIDFLFFEAQILCQMGHTAAAERKPQAADFYRQVLEMTAGQSMNPIVLDAVQGAAGLAAAAGDVAQAVEWLALAASHPNGEWETQQKAQKALTEWRGQLSAEEFSAAQARGRGLALETVMLNVRAWCAVDDV